ncbi:ATP-binding cassette domain-containing protein [Prevotella sp. A2931]|uniref:ATP-binding cassette domain-containing protein n=1 Tax=Prevotella illustrans TaxID=2800387 RepID=A0ABS3M2L0_9BACT|nr:MULTISPECIES: ATP-binding cassette domain-containing protein [Prevotella]MBO1362428.1 ATP-binding cassette domain-containing protein [Prevotella illustrans]PTL25058.1 ABC transporter ATP-binding protein [Prevotella sp. oral taxon 820]
MDQITFSSVVPQVFSAQVARLNTDIWNAETVFQKGKLYLLEADSGKGKSTFCSYVLGYRHDYSGQILFDTRPAEEMKIRDWTDIRKRHISLLFQELRLFPELTALENVQIKNRLTEFKSRQDIVRWFEQLGIADKLDAPVRFMSFGQQQRVAMMRALAQPFDFIVVDEPISHLDDNNSRVMSDILMSEARAQGAGIIATSIGKRMELPYDKVLRL